MYHLTFLWSEKHQRLKKKFINTMTLYIFPMLFFFLQFTVNAVDRGGRSATIPASVRVTVIRNTNAPVFTNLPNANQINHNTSIGTQVFPVSARDPDPVSTIPSNFLFLYFVLILKPYLIHICYKSLNMHSREHVIPCHLKVTKY